MITGIKVIKAKHYAAIYIVGDLHGCYHLLMQELQRVHFNFETDLLVCTGDLVDRGSENMQCISLLDQSRFCAVRGNHEELCIKGQYDLQLKDLHIRNGGAWFYRQFKKTQEQIVQKILNMPLVIEIELSDRKIGVIHADIAMNDWNAFKDMMNNQLHETAEVQSVYHNCLWGRGRIKNRSDIDGQVAHIDEIYLGHTMVKKHTVIDNCHYIDVGSYFSQALCLVKIQ